MRRVLAAFAAAALTAAGLALTATAANAAPAAPAVYDCSTYSPVVNGEIETFVNALNVKLPADPGGVALNCTPISTAVGGVVQAVNPPVQCTGAQANGLVLTGCTPYTGS